MRKIKKPMVAKARHPLTGKWQIFGASAAAQWLVATGKAEKMSRATVWRIAAGCAEECGIHSRTAELVLKHFPAWR